MIKNLISISVVLIIILIINIQKKIDDISTDYGEVEFYYIPEISTLKMFSLGYSSFLADVYWIKGVLYFGKKATKTDEYPILIKTLDSKQKELTEAEKEKFKKLRKKYQYFYDFINIVTELDPYFKLPYIFGGLFLSMKAGNPYKAIEILEKGQKIYPNEWRIYYFKGFNYLFYLNDKRGALINFVKAANIPGCTEYAVKMAKALVRDYSKKELLKGFLEDYKKRDKKFEEEINRILEQIEKSKDEVSS